VNGWDIHPEGVNSVVTKTSETAKGLEGAAKSYTSALQSGANSSGSQIVAMAVQCFAEHHRTTFETLVNHTVSTLTAGVNATRAYLDGDLEMAAEAQRNAGK
jgi:hypothetical protein